MDDCVVVIVLLWKERFHSTFGDLIDISLSESSTGMVVVVMHRRTGMPKVSF